MEENKVIELENNKTFITKPNAISDEDLMHEYDYYQAQKILEDMRKRRMITDDEFNKITALNREKFSPYLSEIMPNVT